MNERSVGIAYCLVTIIHLIVLGIIRHTRKDFRDPGLAVARVMVWPATDALWLVRRWRTWWSAAAMVVTMLAAGCQPYKDYLYSLPVTERTHNDEAVAIVSEAYGIDYRVPETRWIVQDVLFETEDGKGALGVTHDCVSWVLWPSLYGPDPRNSLTFGHTVMAHEMAHCALWLYRGDGDADHSDVVWWGTKGEGLLGGLVGVAMNALVRRGM